MFHQLHLPKKMVERVPPYETQMEAVDQEMTVQESTAKLIGNKLLRHFAEERIGYLEDHYEIQGQLCITFRVHFCCG
jgi:hypothetical protein